MPARSAKGLHPAVLIGLTDLRHKGSTAVRPVPANLFTVTSVDG